MIVRKNNKGKIKKINIYKIRKWENEREREREREKKREKKRKRLKEN